MTNARNIPSTRNVIFELERFFSSYDIPNNIVSGNSPPFTSYELQGYFISKGIKHHKTCPLWPQANDQVERFMPSLNKVSQTAFLERKDWKLEIYKFSFPYQNCPHTTTKIPPSDLMFNRKVKFTFPHINKINIDYVNNELENNISASKQHAKEYHDKRYHAKNISLLIGDRVMVKQRKLNKLTPIFEQPPPYIVIETKGTLIKAKEENSNRVVTKNISHFCKIPKDAVFPNNTSDESDNDLEYSRHDNNANHNQNNRRYPLRNRQSPCRYGTAFEH